MESYCSLCTFKVPQGANNSILCTLDTSVHRLFIVTRLIINKINKVQEFANHLSKYLNEQTEFVCIE
jgi:hypothetical protein